MTTAPLWQFWMSWIAQVAIAAGSISAVIVALFGNWLRARLFPPKLALSLQNPRGTRSPAILKTPDGDQRQEDSRWYHVLVENHRRLVSPATQVQVFLIRVEEPDATGENKIVWSEQIPLTWRHQEVHPIARTIGYAADCNLCNAVKGKWLELTPIAAPFALKVRRRLGESCRFTVTLQARSVETDSNLLRIEIAWDGQWADDSDEMARHLVVKAVS
jgi:hypothetical protein